MCAFVSTLKALCVELWNVAGDLEKGGFFIESRDHWELKISFVGSALWCTRLVWCLQCQHPLSAKWVQGSQRLEPLFGTFPGHKLRLNQKWSQKWSS